MKPESLPPVPCRIALRGRVVFLPMCQAFFQVAVYVSEIIRE